MPPLYYRDNDASSISKLLLEQGRIRADAAQRSGDIQAQRAANSGQIWGNAIGNVGQIAAGAVQEHAERKEQSKRSRAFEAAIESGDPRRILSVLGPRDGAAVINALKASTPDGMKKYTDRMVLLRDLARGVKATPVEDQPQTYDFAIKSLVTNGALTPEEAAQYTAYDKNVVDQLANYGKEQKEPTGRIWVTRDGKPVRVSESEILPGDVPHTAPKEPKKYQVEVPGAGGPVAKLVTEEELAAGVQTYRAPVQGPQPPNLQHIETDKGIQPFNPRTGQLGPVIAQGKPAAPQSQRLTKEERQDFAAMNYALPKLDAFTKYVEANPDKYGKWDAFKQNLKQAMPGLADEEYASQEAFITRVNAEIRHALYGAALTGSEQQSAEGFIVSASDQPVRIVAKVREAMTRARSNVKYYQDLGFNLPAAPGGSPGGGDQPGAITVKAPNGKVYTFSNKAEADGFKKRTGIR